MPFKDLPEGQTQYLDENGNTVGETSPFGLTFKDVREFFNMKDKERDNIVFWLNKITGLNYNLRRSDEKRNTSSMMLCLGEDKIVINQDWVR